ncbi:Gfo/Idh/MocA family oxidoreductase [Kineococcus sp. NPDC059986]|uniref:Gfo/Idh/MocA family protein n=1 Tax=Kineococcus sp. NPDC059986 TaxID=3155538 RepID=UPI003450CBC4
MPSATTDTVRLGIIGLGTQGGTYARFVADGRVPGTTVGAIADTDPVKAERAAAEFGDVPFFTDHLAMLDSGTVDAVVTCVPHYLHPQMGVDAIERGVHVLVEKPAGVHSLQVKRLNAVAAAHPEVTFGVMFNQRSNPLYRRLKEIVEAGQIGRIIRSNWIITTWWRPQGYYEQSAWRATWGGEGGGVLVNQAPHQLDLWQWICGVPRSVFAKVSYGLQRDIAVEDEVTVLADFGGGSTGVFVTAVHDLVGTDRLEIQGDAGKIVVEGSKVATVTRLAKPEREISAGMTAEQVAGLFRGQFDTSELYTTETIEFPSAWGDQHVAVLANFAAAVRGEEELIAPGAEGLLGVRLANAVHLSSWTGQEVGLDFDDEHYLKLLNERIADEGLFPQRQGGE